MTIEDYEGKLQRWSRRNINISKNSSKNSQQNEANCKTFVVKMRFINAREWTKHGFALRKAYCINYGFSGLGSFSNDDGDGKRGRQKNNRFVAQNNNFARASRFFVHSFTVLRRLRRENA